jgi:hypothetical protein
MGEESGVSKAIGQVKKTRDAELNRLKRRLMQGMDEDRENETRA